MKIKHMIISMMAVTALAAGIGYTPLYAQEGEGRGEQTAVTSSRDDIKRQVQEQRAAIKDRVQGKLSDVKKRICEQRVSKISQLMTTVGANGAKHLQHISTAQTRIEGFYTAKNLTVANYEALVATANSKKTAAQAVVDAVKTNTSFSCDGDNPVGNIDAFNGKIRAMYQALKDYRSAVKDLLVAVKTAAQTKEQQ